VDYYPALCRQSTQRIQNIWRGRTRRLLVVSIHNESEGLQLCAPGGEQGIYCGKMGLGEIAEAECKILEVGEETLGQGGGGGMEVQERRAVGDASPGEPEARDTGNEGEEAGVEQGRRICHL
jgi:hypothetical protein